MLNVLMMGLLCIMQIHPLMGQSVILDPKKSGEQKISNHKCI